MTAILHQTKVNAGILAYNRPESLIALIRSLRAQTYPLQRIIIVDNSPSDLVKDALSGSEITAEYYKNEENTGSAGGFNLAIKMAMPGCEFVWVFDDDINVHTEALQELLKAHDNLASNHRVGAVRCWYDCYNSTKTPQPISSFAWRGTLLKTTVIERIGLPDKDFFLYGEDLDYSIRIARAGYKMYYVPRSLMWVNGRSTKIVKRVAGRDFEFNNTPFRQYYSVRNELLLNRKHRQLFGFFRSLAYDLRLLALIAIYHSEAKAAFLHAILLGIYDGLRGKKGRARRYIND